MTALHAVFCDGERGEDIRDLYELSPEKGSGDGGSSKELRLL